MPSRCLPRWIYRAAVGATMMLAVGILAVGMLAVGAEAAEVRCEIETAFVCTKKGCEAGETGGWSLVNFAANTLTRCDPRGCASHAMVPKPSGLYIDLEIDGQSMLVRIKQDGSAYVEAVTLGPQVLLGYGACE